MFQWNETKVNNTASTSCFYGPTTEVITRQCVSRLTWAVPTVDQCRTVISEQFSNIQQVRVCHCSSFVLYYSFVFKQVNVSSENVNAVISNVSSIVASANQTSDQNSDNLRAVADVLTQSVDAIQNVSSEVARQVSLVLNLCNKQVKLIISTIIGYNKCCGNTGQC